MIVLGGRRLQTPFASLCWLESPELRLSIPEDGRRRPPGRDILALCWHSTQGKGPVVVLPGVGAPGGAVRTFRFWRDEPTHAGAHFVVDRDGVVCQGADPVTEIAYHCPDVNGCSVGIEVSQQASPLAFWSGQLDSAADFGAWLSDMLGVPRLVHLPYTGPVPGIAAARGSYGHRDVTDHRGRWDPGDPLMERLRDRAGFRAGPLWPVPSDHDPDHRQRGAAASSDPDPEQPPAPEGA